MFSEEEGKEVFPNPTTNSEAHGEEELCQVVHTTMPRTFSTTAIEWSLGSKVLVTSSRASPQKPHSQEKSVESED
jgi:hypothetical protein